MRADYWRRSGKGIPLTWNLASPGILLFIVPVKVACPAIAIVNQPRSIGRINYTCTPWLKAVRFTSPGAPSTWHETQSSNRFISVL